MAGNRGETRLKRTRRASNPMHEYDRLPADLRTWLSTAALPWSAKSVQKAFDKAYAKTRDRAKALRELDRLQTRLIAKDATQIWGQAHPEASFKEAA